MPFERSPRFTGREPELSELDALLSARGQTAKAAIVGLGGVGKTQLAIEHVFRSKMYHRDLAIFWIPATDPESMLHAYCTIARELDIPGRDEANADVKLLVQTHLTDRTAGRWLLVFDNADDMDMWLEKPAVPKGGKRLIDYLPRNPLGSVLFTTRDRKVAVKLASQNILELREMDAALAVELLSKYSIPSDHVTEADAQALVGRLCNLPLAIVQASAYMNANGLSIADYLTLFDEQDNTALELLSEDFEDDGRYKSVKNPVAATWLISFDRIRERDPLAADYLSFMACVEPKDVPRSILPSGESRKQEWDAMGTLLGYSFVVLRADSRTLDLHRLVHLATRSWLREHGLMVEWTERVTERLDRDLAVEQHHDQTDLRNILPHVRYILASRSGPATEVYGRLAMNYGLNLLNGGRYYEADPPLRMAIELNEEFLGTDHPLTIHARQSWVVMLRVQGRYREAAELGSRLLELTSESLGDEHPATLRSRSELAAISWVQGDFERAEQLLSRVLKIKTRVLGARHLQTLRSASMLALTYGSRGRWVEAQQFQAQLLSVMERTLGAEHLETLICMDRLGYLYSVLRRWEEAEQIVTRVLESRRRILGVENPRTLTSMASLARILFLGQGRYGEAVRLLRDCVAMSSKQLGPENPYTVSRKGYLEKWEAAWLASLAPPPHEGDRLSDGSSAGSHAGASDLLAIGLMSNPYTPD